VLARSGDWNRSWVAVVPEDIVSRAPLIASVLSVLVRKAVLWVVGGYFVRREKVLDFSGCNSHPVLSVRD
jgi:hypothetical protein